MTLDEQYRRALSERIPITEGNIIAGCLNCNGPIRMGEPVRGAMDGKLTHFFRQSCQQEQEFQALQLKVWGIKID